MHLSRILLAACLFCSLTIVFADIDGVAGVEGDIPMMEEEAQRVEQVTQAPGIAPHSAVPHAKTKDSMDKLHGTASFVNFTAYSWNIFRYIGDDLHLFGVIWLLLAIAYRKSVSGLSKSTQLLYFLVFATRYLDLLDHNQSNYLVFFKCAYIFTSVLACFSFWQLEKTYDWRNDTCNLSAILFPCLIAALIIPDEYSALEILWTFSEFLEAFAMVPQYVFCYREKVRGEQFRGNVWNNLYIIAIGMYRVFYAFNWIYKKYRMPHYTDVQSWLGGVVEILFFADFLNYRFTGHSMLRWVVLAVDSTITQLSDKVELKVIGSTSNQRKEAREDGSEVRQRRKIGEEQPLDHVI